MPMSVRNPPNTHTLLSILVTRRKIHVVGLARITRLGPKFRWRLLS